MKRWMGRAAMIGLMVTQATAARAEKDRYEVGEEVKNFTLKVLNPEEAGEPYVGIDRYYGPQAKEAKKAILLSFFATYCEPCKREMPYLEALYGLYKSKGLMILSVSIDKEPDKIEEVKALAKEANVSFPVLSDRFNIVAKRYFIEKLPCVYLIDGQGKVAMVNIGYNDDISKELLDQIRKSIGEPTSEPVPDVLARYMHGNLGESAVTVPKDAEPAVEGSTDAVDNGEQTEVTTAEAASDEEPKKTKPKKRRKKRRKKRKKRGR
jgi:thiol-disulfide isomerase/thioredoxin